MLEETLTTIEAAFAQAPRPPPRQRRAAVDSTIWSLSPENSGDAELREFAASKFELLDERQRAAAVTFLEAAGELGDEYVAAEAAKALAWWRRG